MSDGTREEGGWSAGNDADRQRRENEEAIAYGIASRVVVNQKELA